MGDALAARVLDYCREQEAFLVELLERLVEAESPSSHPSLHDAARHAFMAALSDVELTVREVGPPGGPRHVYARPRERNKGRGNQLLVGHTVS